MKMRLVLLTAVIVAVGLVLLSKSRTTPEVVDSAAEGMDANAAPVATVLLQNAVFIVIPDMNPDATAAGSCNDPDDGKTAQWRYNPAAIDRMMPGMVCPMTAESKVCRPSGTSAPRDGVVADSDITAAAARRYVALSWTAFIFEAPLLIYENRGIAKRDTTAPDENHRSG